MKVGTKSVLFGAHCFFIHPFFVARAWTRLYGFPRDPRIWVCFFLHDIGYWGMPNMDGPEGEEHPRLGAGWVSALFDNERDEPWALLGPRQLLPLTRFCNRRWGKDAPGGQSWYSFCFWHSRFMCRKYGKDRVSMLGVADKLSIVYTPAWLYIPMVNWTGEIHEYMKLADARHAEGEPRFVGKYVGMNVWSADQQQWYANVQRYLKRWVAKMRHPDMVDEWTPRREVVCK